MDQNLKDILEFLKDIDLRVKRMEISSNTLLNNSQFPSRHPTPPVINTTDYVGMQYFQVFKFRILIPNLNCHSGVLLVKPEGRTSIKFTYCGTSTKMTWKLVTILEIVINYHYDWLGDWNIFTGLLFSIYFSGF